MQQVRMSKKERLQKKLQEVEAGKWTKTVKDIQQLKLNISKCK